MQSTLKHRILIIDNHVLVRCGEWFLLNSHFPNAEVKIFDSCQAAEVAASLIFDLVIMGTSIYEGEGEIFLEGIKMLNPNLHVMIVSIGGDKQLYNNFRGVNNYTFIGEEVDTKSFISAAEAALPASIGVKNEEPYVIKFHNGRHVRRNEIAI